jgi:hypothetical protein
MPSRIKRASFSSRGRAAIRLAISISSAGGDAAKAAREAEAAEAQVVRRREELARLKEDEI